MALTEGVPQRGLSRGQVGTVIESLAPGVFEVEFSDNDGRAYARVALRAEQLMVLHYRTPPAGVYSQSLSWRMPRIRAAQTRLVNGGWEAFLRQAVDMPPGHTSHPGHRDRPHARQRHQCGSSDA